MRLGGRKNEELREISITRGYTKYAEGSVLIEFGDTKVLCNASVEDSVPRFLKGKGQGWVTAEYGMIPRSTDSRMEREATRSQRAARSIEIQRLIGRSLRAVVDLNKLGERTIKVDCDVLQADGGTRTASITGACVALVDAISHILQEKLLTESPLKQLVASVSVGLLNGQIMLDLDYGEDSGAETDMNFVMTEFGQYIEIQGTGEEGDFSRTELLKMMNKAEIGIKELIEIQRKALALNNE
mgnify:FL=1|tara:strand:+ start:3364 stop:4089 length:726 start_codon:yes stop_codon:yes gene_type:complete